MNRKYVLPFVECIDHCNYFRLQWMQTREKLEELREAGDCEAALAEADAALDALDDTINNKVEAFNILLELNEAYEIVFAVPRKQVAELETLRDFELLARMRQAEADNVDSLPSTPKNAELCSLSSPKAEEKGQLGNAEAQAAIAGRDILSGKMETLVVGGNESEKDQNDPSKRRTPSRISELLGWNSVLE